MSSEPGHCRGCLAVLLCVRGPPLWEAGVKRKRETRERRCARSLWAGHTLSRGPRTGHGAETWATQGKVRGPHSSSCRWEPSQAAQGGGLVAVMWQGCQRWVCCCAGRAGPGGRQESPPGTSGLRESQPSELLSWRSSSSSCEDGRQTGGDSSWTLNSV